MRYGDLDVLLAGALQSTWVTTVVSGVAASAYFSGATINAGSSLLAACVSGQFIRVAGASATANNGDYRITALASMGAGRHNISLADASSGAAASFTSDVFVAATTLKGKNIRNGTTSRSYTVEKAFADVSTFHVYKGMRVTSLGLNFQSQAILTGSMGFTGKSQIASTTATASAVTAASTNEVMNASGNVARIWEGSQVVTGVVFQNVTLDLNNNPREQTRVGSDALAGVATGRCEITGGLSAYFEDNTLINKFIAGTASSFRFQVTDADGNSYIFTIPRTKYTDFTITATGPNNDVMQAGSWGATVDSTGTYAIQIDALDA